MGGSKGREGSKGQKEGRGGGIVQLSCGKCILWLSQLSIHFCIQSYFFTLLNVFSMWLILPIL